MDSDDYVSASLVEKAVSCAEQNQADVVVFDYQEIELCSGGKQTRTSHCLPGRSSMQSVPQLADPHLHVTSCISSFGK
ncbi:MAG: hypothetical protein ACLVB1_04855 [Blautia obeum]